MCDNCAYGNEVEEVDVTCMIIPEIFNQIYVFSLIDSEFIFRSCESLDLITSRDAEKWTKNNHSANGW